MKQLITYDKLRLFAYSNDKICQKPIRGVAISFFGLNGVKMFDEDTPEAIAMAERGILYVVPYNNPWAWMNSQSVQYTDRIIDVLFEQYGLSNSIPIVSTGSSMGGLAALVYMVKAKRTPVACVANCPVCDLPYHYTERPDLPRTLCSAFWHETCSIDEALKAGSPLHLASSMPDSDYFIFHCGADTRVNKQLHSDVFVAKMQENHRVVYHVVPDRDHGALTDEMWEKFYQYIYDSVDKYSR